MPDELDVDFDAAMCNIWSAIECAPRHIRKRGLVWAKKLDSLFHVQQDELRRDRNLQAQLLLRCLEQGTWTEPFEGHPPDGPLPKLPPHLVCQLRGRAQSPASARASRGHTPLRLAPQASCGGHLPDPAPLLGPAAWSRSPSRLGAWDGAPGRVAPAPRGGSRGARARRPSASWLEAQGVADEKAAEGTELSTLGAHAAQGGPIGGLEEAGGAGPPSYEDLAAWVLRLQAENRRLRSELARASQAQPPPPWALGPAAGGASSEGGRASLPASACPGLAGPPPRSRSTSPTTRGQLDGASWREFASTNSHGATHGAGWQDALAAALAPLPAPPGPAPPEQDTEGFLRYLDRFQAYTGSLVSVPPAAA